MRNLYKKKKFGVTAYALILGLYSVISSVEVVAKTRFGLGMDIRYSILTNYERGLRRFGSYEAENSLGVTPGGYLEFTLGKRCLLEAGLSYEYLKHKVNITEYDNSLSYVPYYTQEYAALHYLKLPIIYKYRFTNSSKLGWHISAGLIFKYLITSKGELGNHSGVGPYMNNPYSYIGLSPTIGINFQTGLGNGHKAELGIVANYELVPFTVNRWTLEGSFKDVKMLQIAIRSRFYFH